jgi:DNA mismatch repair ATPase MutL
LHSEELLKKHNLKHLESRRAEQDESVSFKDKHSEINTRTANDRIQDYHGSAKSVKSPVICSASSNIVTGPNTSSERGYKERRSSNIDDEIIPSELTNQNGVRDDVIQRSNCGPCIPYYEARKQTHGYFNVMSQGQAMVVSAMHAAMDTNARYHVPNGLLYTPARSRSGYTIQHH